MAFYMKEKNWRTLLNYANAAYNEFKSEITGYMTLSKDDDSDWEMKNPIILKQEVGSGSCEIDKEDSANYFVDAFDRYGEDVRFVWWHTHANMGAFWSSTDTQNMEDQCSNGWAASLVINIKGEYKFRVNFNDPVKAYADTEIAILNQKSKKIPKRITDEVKSKCSKPTYNYNKSNNYQYGWNNGYYKNFKSNQMTLAGTGTPLLNQRNKAANNWYELYADLRDHIDAYTEGELAWKDLKFWIQETNKEIKLLGGGYFISDFNESDIQSALMDIGTGYCDGYNITDYDQFIVQGDINQKKEGKNELPY